MIRTCFAHAASPCKADGNECLCARDAGHAGLCKCANCGKYYAGKGKP